VENLSNATLNLAHQGIGEDGVKALAKSLLVRRIAFYSMFMNELDLYYESC